MTRQQTRLFAIIATALTAVIFIGMTLHSHTQFDELTNAQNITPEVHRGKDAWHKNNCVNCHTLLGEGAYFAPDLTKITDHRGIPYLTAFLKDPSKFYSDEKHRRLMPTLDMTDQEIDDVLQFLVWISKIDTNGWPPRPILVTGASIPGTDTQKPQRPAAASDDPVALGDAVFHSTPPGCFACHSVAAGVDLVGPSLASLASKAETLISTDEYTGGAKTAREYIRESIVAPSAYLIPGNIYSSNGVSFMPGGYEVDMTAEQIDQVVDYLMTLN